jgi:hypothetical protein
MRCWCGFILFLCLCLASCGPAPYGANLPYPTTGVILVDGKPANKANIVLFHEGEWGPTGAWGARPIVPQAWTNEEGRFALSTYDSEDGAPAGDYRVIVSWYPHRKGRDTGPDSLGGRYAKADSSNLKARIEKGPNELKFDLELSPAQVKANEANDAKYAAGKAPKAVRARDR